MNVRWTMLAISLLWLAAAAGCGKSDAPPAASIDGTAAAAAGETTPVVASDSGGETKKSAAKAPTVNLFPEVVIKTNQGAIRIKLNAEKAPQTVENFLDNYVRRDFYPGTVFHYATPEMLIAGGFDAQLQPKETRARIRNEATNGLKNKRGTVAMVRDPAYAQSATSQFMIHLVDNPALDHTSAETSEEFGYCVFGEIVSGLEVAEAIAKVAVHDQGDFISTPVEPVVIESIEQVK